MVTILRSRQSTFRIASSFMVDLLPFFIVVSLWASTVCDNSNGAVFWTRKWDCDKKEHSKEILCDPCKLAWKYSKTCWSESRARARHGYGISNLNLNLINVQRPQRQHNKQYRLRLHSRHSLSSPHTTRNRIVFCAVQVFIWKAHRGIAYESVVYTGFKLEWSELQTIVELLCYSR